MSFLSRLLTSLLQISPDDEQPASCLQPVLAWKERVVEHQELSDSSLNTLAIETCQKEQEELGEHNRVDDQANNSLQQEQDKPDKLVKGGQGGAYRPQPTAQRGKGEHKLPNSRQRACKGKPEEGKGKTDPNFKGKGQESIPSFKRELEHRGKQGRQEQRKEKGEAYSPQPRAYQGKGEQQLPNNAHRACRDKLEPKGGKKEKGPAYKLQPPWRNFCWKTGHTAQACWWNTSAQQQKHQQKNFWRSPRRKKQLQRDNGDQSFADWLASNKSLMSSFEKQSQDKA